MKNKFDYKFLENINISDEYTCIFGQGKIGKTNALWSLKAAGFAIDFYCDNKYEDKREYDGIPIISPEELYSYKSNVIVFVAINDIIIQKNIIEQLNSNGVTNVYVFDHRAFSQLCDSIDTCGDDFIKEKYALIYDNREYLSNTYKYFFGKKPDFDDPQTFNEKLNWLKLCDRQDIYTDMVDKYKVKNLVGKRIGEQYIIPTLGVYDTFDEIDFDSLPDKFVLKCNHDSGSAIICRDKEHFDKEAAREKMNHCMEINYFWPGREWPYKNIERKIIAEKYLEDNPIDYKVMCFHGIPKLLFTCTGRSEGKLKVTFFDLNWGKLDFERHYPADKEEIKKPDNLEKMLDLARQLSSEIPFVRVDFYDVNNILYFGEMTFYPGNGMEEFTPEEWDYKLGKYIKCPAKIDK